MTIKDASKRPTIYLAGQVGGDKWKLTGGYEDRAYFVASDGSSHSEHLWGYGVDYSASHLKDAVEDDCLKLIRECYILVALLDTPTAYGTIAEIAYASAIGKDCLLIILEDAGKGVEHEAMLDAFWFVSCLPGVRAGVAYTFDQARESFSLIVDLAEKNKIVDTLNALGESPLEDAFFKALCAAGGDYEVGWDDAPYVTQKHQNIPYKIKPQYEVRLSKTYRLDFYIETPSRRIAVEIDGHDFHERTKEQARRDKERDRAFTAAGYAVLRFTGSEIYRDVDGAVAEVLSLVGGA